MRSRTCHAARCGTTVYPCAARRSASSSVGSRPFLGDVVTVTFTSSGTCSRTSSSAPASGMTSYRGRARSAGSDSVDVGRLPGSGERDLLLGRVLLRVDERLPDDDRLLFAGGCLDLELGAEHREFDRQHRVADVLLEPRRVAGGGDAPNLLPVLRHREVVDHCAVVVAAEAWPADLHSYELARDPLRLDPLERLLADEVGFLFEIDHPLVAHLHLVRVRVEPHVAAEGEDAGLDPLDVARADDGEPVRLSGLQDGVPQLHAVLARVLQVDLVPELTRVAGARDDDV